MIDTTLDQNYGGWWDEAPRGGQVCRTHEQAAHDAETERKHKEWLATEAGAAWFNAQPWNAHLPLVRVKVLGWQPGLNGAGVMLYNTLSGYVLDGSERAGCTVTLGSLVKLGYRVEVVKY